MGDPAEPFGLFVSCVEGQPVTRFGTRVFIGAARDPANPRKLVYHPDQIIAVPHLEAQRFGREYARAILDGSLVQRSAAEWREQQRSEGGAPRKSLTSGDSPPAASEAKGATNADHEGGSQ